MTKILVGRCLLQNILYKRGMSQLDLSHKTGISTSQISDYVKQRRIMSLPTAKRIAIALNCHIDDLYEWDKE